MITGTEIYDYLVNCCTPVFHINAIAFKIQLTAKVEVIEKNLIEISLSSKSINLNVYKMFNALRIS